MNLTDLIVEMAKLSAQAFPDVPKTISFFLGVKSVNEDGNVDVVAWEVQCNGKEISASGNVRNCGLKLRFDLPCGIMS
jgi:hypothetical protein